MQMAFKAIGVAIVALVLALLTMRTWAHQMVWLNDESLWRHVVEHNPQARNAFRYWGVALGEQERDEEALAAFRLAIQQRPDDPKVHINIGSTLNMLERHKEAERHLRQGFALDPDVNYYHINLGIALYGQDRLEEAAAALRLVKEQSLDYEAAQRILSTIQRQQAQQKEPSP